MPVALGGRRRGGGIRVRPSVTARCCRCIRRTTKGTGSLEGRRTSQLLGGAVGGFQPWTVATLRTVSFAGVEFLQVPADFAPDTLSGANSNRVVGNIGNSILARFHLIIDYSHDRLYAIPYPDTATAAFAKDRLGLASTRVGPQLRVDFVAPGSPAQAAGFTVGEKITRINGRARSVPGQPQRCSRCATSRPVRTSNSLSRAAARGSCS